uniref:Centrosomal protein 170 n=1 Tax=Callorhinchus milii TaxID=7868 RepID=A0A4W3K707_CALMI
MSLTSWFLVSSGGTRHRLPREMIFVGRDDCELMLQSRSVDKQHAVINYDALEDEHKVKDLGSLNGTFVNETRIPDQSYITLKIDDKLRFGYDILSKSRGELRVPEEALKHEKFTSQLQLTPRPPEAEVPKQVHSSSEEAKAEVIPIAAEMPKVDGKSAVDLSAMPRGTPLYGQPSWWGEDDADDENSSKQDPKPETGKLENSFEANKLEDDGNDLREVPYPFCREPSYFEIPTKEFHQSAQLAESSIHEIPTKDTETSHTVVQGHASFTIEFDDNTPGKVTIKDHVTKFTPDQRHKQKKSPPATKEVSGLQAAMIAAESKVADWLAQNNPPRMRCESTEDDSKSIKSDIPIQMKRLKGNKHDDGTQSDTENGNGHRHAYKHVALEDQLKMYRTEQQKFLLQQNSNPTKSSHNIPGHHQNKPLQNQKTVESSPPLPSSQTALLQSSGSIEHRPSQSQEQEQQKQISPSAGKENEDDQSDKGTYTIELENPNPEEEEARRMIDMVRVLEDVYCSQFCLHNILPTALEGSFTCTSPQWVSQWTGLAANHKGADPNDQRPNSESGVSAKSASTSDTTSASMSDRKRRTLPQLPTEDKTSESQKSKAPVSLNLTKTRPEIGEKQDTELPEKGTPTPPHPKDRQKEITRGIAKNSSSLKAGSGGNVPGASTNHPQPIKEKVDAVKGISAVRQPSPKSQQQVHRESPPQRTFAKTSKAGDLQESRQAAASILDKVEAHTEEKRRKSEEISRSPSSKGGNTEKKDSQRPLVRQGSFTIEKPSSNVPLELIPRITREGGSPGATSATGRERSNSIGTDSSMDTTVLLKDTEAVMAFLEAKLREENKLDGGADTPSYHVDDSISPESDIDTASTISLVSGDAEKKSIQKRRTLSSLHKEKSFTKSPAKDQSRITTTNARDKLADKKTKSRASDANVRSESRRPLQTTGRARQASFDLTDDDQTSSLPQSTISDFLSSDQETYSSRSQGRTSFTSTDELLHSKLEGSKLSKTKTSAVNSSTGKSTNLPKPRPTRTSILRRARLGDASDNELADADKVSVVSEVSTTSSTTSKPPSGRKTPSRLDLLAQPRRNRLGSISARSDSEATITRSNVNRASDSSFRSNLRTTSTSDNKPSPRMRANSISRMPDSSKTKTSTAGHGPPSGARWRRFPTEYASTSEDEFGSNRSSPKHTRLRSTAALRTSKLQNTNAVSSNMLLKNKMKEQDDYIRDWTAHSEEIARISQDLAKDLAILAREIHDVAGEIDSVSSSGTAPSTTVSTAATTPGSTIDTREELVDRVFDESLNFRKIPPATGNGRPGDPRSRISESADQQAASKRKTWSRDEAVLDSLMLTSVSQLSQKIRHIMEKTALKIRILFKDHDRNWEEIENKMRAESEVPILKTSNKEISLILQELKRVEKQLQAINVMIDPDGALDSACGFKLASPSLPGQAKHKSSPTHRSPIITPRELEHKMVRPSPVSSEFDSVQPSHPEYSHHYTQRKPNGEGRENSGHE